MMTNWMTHLTDRMFMRRQPRESVSFVALFQTFKHILTLNNQILESIADMGDKLGGDYVFDRQYIRASSRQVGLLVDELIYHSISWRRRNTAPWIPSPVAFAVISKRSWPAGWLFRRPNM
ncbi:hypothetical protein [Desulfosarcina cetonica]|uniref:hypothetical protein n=1 Tax=Desulfosarcina cetonica TaxID=90730 RepID=UPI0006D056CE|nr:hypothetical protein [Desulfosarcina cetonica]